MIAVVSVMTTQSFKRRFNTRTGEDDRWCCGVSVQVMPCVHHLLCCSVLIFSCYVKGVRVKGWELTETFTNKRNFRIILLIYYFFFFVLLFDYNLVCAGSVS